MVPRETANGSSLTCGYAEGTARSHESTPTGYRYKSIELMEISNVSIPSCPTWAITSKAAQQRVKSTAPHTTMREGDMNGASETYDVDLAEVNRLITRIVPEECGKAAVRAIGELSKAPEDDWFQHMCDSMLSAYSEMDSRKFRELMRAQLSLLGPNAPIADLVRALQSACVYAPKHWASDTDLIDVDERELGMLVGNVIGEEAGRQTKAALNAPLGRLD